MNCNLARHKQAKQRHDEERVSTLPIISPYREPRQNGTLFAAYAMRMPALDVTLLHIHFYGAFGAIGGPEYTSSGVSRSVPSWIGVSVGGLMSLQAGSRTRWGCIFGSPAKLPDPTLGTYSGAAYVNDKSVFGKHIQIHVCCERSSILAEKLELQPDQDLTGHDTFTDNQLIGINGCEV